MAMTPQVKAELATVVVTKPACRRAEVAAWLAERLGVACPKFGDLEVARDLVGANPFGGRRRAPDRIVERRRPSRSSRNIPRLRLAAWSRNRSGQN